MVLIAIQLIMMTTWIFTPYLITTTPQNDTCSISNVSKNYGIFVCSSDKNAYSFLADCSLVLFLPWYILMGIAYLYLSRRMFISYISPQNTSDYRSLFKKWTMSFIMSCEIWFSSCAITSELEQTLFK
ncbi:hypothetical protein RF11_02090 [Thelohanellus kitauei]|uniref:Uncharacterized protein n=1 Tax=Thelohanellus kitauei TaxID=669202 RepID=A0A0C2MQ21_THEKT|nr:hypothetical protein RF11_02090 [Thelohanellus kitauei]